MVNTDKGFHWKYGWYFKRLEDGSVVISKEDERVPSENQPAIPLATIDPDSWASIVASVCALGEDGRTHREASQLHRTGYAHGHPYTGGPQT